MSLHLPSKRALHTAVTTFQICQSRSPLIIANSNRSLPSSASFISNGLLTANQRRFLGWRSFFGRKKKTTDKSDNTFGKNLDSAEGRKALMDQLSVPTASRGSILAEELEKEGTETGPETQNMSRDREGRAATVMGGSLVKEHIARAVDPDPASRVRWQRKMVIRHVHRNLDVNGRETKAERIGRTERRLVAKSGELPTSMKKLVHLARQVAGKTVEDALVQMRFSKKKMARQVRWQLEEARDAAVVERGMGLGRVNGEVLPEGKGIKVQTKDGKWMTVQDPTRLYIEQAWVNKRGLRYMRHGYAARGRINILRSPSTDLTLVIKEERTRIREYQEREAKKARKAPWLHLPDRPVTAQRQHYSW